MLGVAAGLAAVMAVVLGTLYLIPESTTTPAPAGGAAATPVAFDKALADRGKQVAASNGCTSCHSLDGSKGVGPSWKGVFGTDADVAGAKVPVDEKFIETAILDPNAQVRSGFGPSMPSYKGKLSAEDVTAIVEYMKSLNG